MAGHAGLAHPTGLVWGPPCEEVEFLRDRDGDAPAGGRVQILLGTGLNLHGQLGTADFTHWRRFAEVHRCGSGDEGIDVLFAGGSTTVVVSREGVVCKGHQSLRRYGATGVRLRCGIGDDDGLKACLDQLGRCYLYSTDHGGEGGRRHASPGRLLAPDLRRAPRICHLAYAAASDHVAVIPLHDHHPADEFRLYTFPSFEEFATWCRDPIYYSGRTHRPHHRRYIMRGRARQLVGAHATFILLLDDGEVYTWGNARFSSTLGRPVAGERTQPADAPGRVEELSGLGVAQVAAGGWMNAAVTDNGSLYLWGALMKDNLTIDALRPGKVSLVELPTDPGGQPPDVQDVALGHDHIAVLASNRTGLSLYLTGDNTCGQLGLQEPPRRSRLWESSGWTELPSVEGRPYIKVFCGPSSTFPLIEQHLADETDPAPRA